MKPNRLKQKTLSIITVQTLSNLPPFEEFKNDSESLKTLCSLGHIKTLLTGQILLRQKEEVHEVSVILRGKIQVFIQRDLIDPIVLEAGRVIGEISLFKNTLSTASAIALEETQLICFNKKTLQELIQKDPKLGLKLYQGLVRDTVDKLESMTDRFLIPKPSPYHQLISLFDLAFRGLGKTVSPEEIEYLSGLVYQVMSAKGRLYHRPEHILDITQNAPPIETLALLFHDTVYVQVDKRIHPLLRPYLEEFQPDDDFKVLIPHLKKETQTRPQETEVLRSLISLFGFKEGDTLSTSRGMNEFLSAVVAARALRKYLTDWEVIQMGCCIEATIPFRPADANDQTSCDILLGRLTKEIKRQGIKKSKTEVIETVHLAVNVANRDVGGFAAEHTGFFIAQTWNLILEGNPIFRNFLYTVRQYREALQRIRKFHINLPVERIFRQFENVPSTKEYARLLNQAKLNRSIQDEYLRISMLALGLLEAVSQLTGGDAPYMLFMGDPAQGISQIERNLGQIQENGKKQPVVLALLRFGRTQTTPFDFKNSPLAAFLYESLDQDSLSLTLKMNDEFLEGNITPMQFLKSLKKNTLSSILLAISELAISRRAKILKLEQDVLH